MHFGMLLFLLTIYNFFCRCTLSTQREQRTGRREQYRIKGKRKAENTIQGRKVNVTSHFIMVVLENR